MNLTSVFLTGLFTGGLTCLAVQGGLLASALAQRAARQQEAYASTGHAAPILVFLGAKTIAYTLLGALLGWFGSVFALSLSASVTLQIIAMLFMLGTALNLLNVHPIFRYFIIQPPKFITRRIRNEAKSGELFAPAILGASTVLLPCGTTQAMMAAAIASGSPTTGAAILATFVLGTSPLFFLLGFFASRLSGSLHILFTRVAAVTILFIVAFMFNGTLTLLGSPVTVDSIWRSTYCTAFSFCGKSDGAVAQAAAPLSEATITIGPDGYSPQNVSIKAGAPITLNLVNKDGNNCAQAFTIPKLGIQRVVRVGQTDTIQFTAPKEPGELAFSCSMGMYKGTFHVI